MKKLLGINFDSVDVLLLLGIMLGVFGIISSDSSPSKAETQVHTLKVENDTLKDKIDRLRALEAAQDKCIRELEATSLLYRRAYENK